MSSYPAFLILKKAVNYIPNIPISDKKRILIAGAGFTGLKLVRKLLGKGFQIVLIDKNNFHQFQPLLYQVATAGPEPSAISFPLRKVLQNEKDIHYRIAEILEILPTQNTIKTGIGWLHYDYLVLAMGATTDFFGQEEIELNSLSVKSASDAILIRNTILENFEKALIETNLPKIDQYLKIVLVGGGPTGVELAGALVELLKYIFTKDYPELDLSKMRIILYEASDRVLANLSEKASEKALTYLRKLKVEVHLNTKVENYNGFCLELSDGSPVPTKTAIWSAGAKANSFEGLFKENIGGRNRLVVDQNNSVIGYSNIFAIGDICLMKTEKYPKGHPQLAEMAIQQLKLLAVNLLNLEAGKRLRNFKYQDKGSLATIGRNLAVSDLPIGKLHGFFAWVLWSFVHLFLIMSIKNRLLIFLKWSWNYFTYNQSLRLLIKPKTKPKPALANFQTANTKN